MKRTVFLSALTILVAGGLHAQSVDSKGPVAAPKPDSAQATPVPPQAKALPPVPRPVQTAPAPAKRKAKPIPAWKKVIVWPPDPPRKDDPAVVAKDPSKDKSGSVEEPKAKEKSNPKPAGKTLQSLLTQKSPAIKERLANVDSKKSSVQGAEGLREDDLKLLEEALGRVRADSKVLLGIVRASGQSGAQVAKGFGTVQKVLRNLGVKPDRVVSGEVAMGVTEIGPDRYILTNGTRVMVLSKCK